MPAIKLNSDKITMDLILSATWKQARMGITWITLSWRSQWVPVTLQKCAVDCLTYSGLRKSNFPGKCNAICSRWSNSSNAFRPHVRWLRSAIFLYSLLSVYRLCMFVYFKKSSSQEAATCLAWPGLGRRDTGHQCTIPVSIPKGSHNGS